VPRAEQLIGVYQTLHSDSRRAIHGSSSYFSIDEYETYRDQNQVISGLIAYAPFVSAALGGETPRSIVGQYASCNYFDVLDEPVALGRTFQSSDCLAAGSAVAVLSDDLWRSAFQADPSIAGKTMLLNGRGFTVAGPKQQLKETLLVRAANPVPAPPCARPIQISPPKSRRLKTISNGGARRRGW
jgi:hypothetical protein